MNTKPQEAMKQQQDILRKASRMARYALVVAAIGVIYAAPALQGAGMNASTSSNPCSVGSSLRLLEAFSAIVPAAQPIQMEDDRQLKPDTTIARTDAANPAKFFLEQNFPNPFRLGTSFRYGLPKNSFVKVTIHTMLGSPIKTLLEETQDAGVYTLDMTVPDLMPGIYFYRVQTEYGVLTRRMTISR